MTIEFAEVHTLFSTPDVQQIPFKKLVASSENERYVLSDIKQLIENIKEVGLQVPLIVHKIERDKYEIIDGHRRYKALEQLKATLVPCIVYERKLTEDELVAIRNATDAYHLGWSAYDRVKLYAKLSATGMKQEEIAKKMNVPVGVIKNLQVLSTLPESLIKYVAKNNVPWTYIYNITTHIATKKMCKKLNLDPKEIVMYFAEKWMAGSIKSRERAIASGKKLYYLNTEDALHWLERKNQGLEVLDALAEEKSLVVDDNEVIDKIITTINKSSGQFTRQLREFPKARLSNEQFERLNDTYKKVQRDFKNLINRLRNYLDD